MNKYQIGSRSAECAGVPDMREWGRKGVEEWRNRATTHARECALSCTNRMNCIKTKSGSRFLYVTRSAGHQWELKEIIALKMLIDNALRDVLWSIDVIYSIWS